MYFRIKFLQGSKAGQELTVPGPMIRFGRDPSCEVAFDCRRLQDGVRRSRLCALD